MSALLSPIDRINQKQLIFQLKNAVMIRKAIIQANEGIIEVFTDQLNQSKAAGADCTSLSEMLEDLRLSNLNAEAELIQFQKELRGIG